ncbi:MAG: cytochrome c [Herminiimonas sp.]|nr:cytochrome c [Herminiimonas sp.]
MPVNPNKSVEHADPFEQANPVPKVVMGMVLALVVWAVSYIFIEQAGGDVALGDQRDPATLTAGAGAPAGAANGAQIFAARCVACHQANGQGLAGVFPPLAGSPWVKGEPALTAQIVLRGLTGPVDVLGSTYNGVMPAFAGQLSDEEMAAVLTHVRGQWGNAAAPVSAAAVGAARALSTARTDPWSGTAEISQALSVGLK